VSPVAKQADERACARADSSVCFVGGWSRLYGKDAHGNSPDSPREGARLEPSVSRPVRVSERIGQPLAAARGALDQHTAMLI
jgi:hypothetical protein